MCKVGHGVSVAVLVETWVDGVALASVRVEEAEIEGFRTGRCVRLPRRCISRPTI